MKKKLTKAVVSDWLEKRGACSKGLQQFAYARSLREAWQNVDEYDASWILHVLDLVPLCFCTCTGCADFSISTRVSRLPQDHTGCADFSKAERLAQWPFELIAALVLEQINK